MIVQNDAKTLTPNVAIGYILSKQRANEVRRTTDVRNNNEQLNNIYLTKKKRGGKDAVNKKNIYILNLHNHYIHIH